MLAAVAMLASCPVHRLQLPPLGQLQKLLVGINNKGQAPSWHMSLVEVLDESTGAVTYFVANRWGQAHKSADVHCLAAAARPAPPAAVPCRLGARKQDCMCIIMRAPATHICIDCCNPCECCHAHVYKVQLLANFAPCRWLGALSSDGLSEVTLTASSTDPRQAKSEYQVSHYTPACDRHLLPAHCLHTLC